LEVVGYLALFSIIEKLEVNCSLAVLSRHIMLWKYILLF